MRNMVANPIHRNAVMTTMGPVCLILCSAIACGCQDSAARHSASASVPSEPAALRSGYAALAQQQFDGALASADAYLQRTPHGPGSAAALYLRGRAYAGRIAPTPDASQRDLADARAAYVQALALAPAQPLDAYIRTSLANVAYFQEDYGTALQQWTIAYTDLPDDDLRAGVLFKIGRCYQWLGQFDRADQTFAIVHRAYPNSPSAPQALAARGARGYQVQLATFASPASAERAAADLRHQGLQPVQITTPTGQHVLRLGPLATLSQARALRARFIAAYPDAIIMP